MKTITVTDASYVVVLGKQGENAAREILFPVSDWIETFGNGDFYLLVQRPDEGRADVYYADITTADEVVHWIVLDTDTVNAGFGECELQLRINNTVAKSVTYSTLINPALSNGGANVRIERGQSDGSKTFVVVYGQESEMEDVDTTYFATGSWFITTDGSSTIYSFDETLGWLEFGGD